jgi:hypothetical protein
MHDISKKPIGMGKERMCYVHPEDPRLAVKVPIGETTKQTEREIRFYRDLKRRSVIDCKHIPKFHGITRTNRGVSIVVDLIRDFDGQISRPLNWYLSRGYPLEDFLPYLDEVRRSFLDNLIIFNHDLTIGNLLVQKSSISRFHLVAIDGLGDVVAFDWLNRIPFFARRKIRRRWQRFMERLYRSRAVVLQREAMAREAQTEY